MIYQGVFGFTLLSIPFFTVAALVMFFKVSRPKRGKSIHNQLINKEQRKHIQRAMLIVIWRFESTFNNSRYFKLLFEASRSCQANIDFFLNAMISVVLNIKGNCPSLLIIVIYL